jgi:hypothetical protein
MDCLEADALERFKGTNNCANGILRKESVASGYYPIFRITCLSPGPGN